MFRCPTCIAVLVEPRARRCETCGQNLRRRRPLVLGEAARVSSRHLPIDRVLADDAARQLATTWQAPAPATTAAPRVRTAPAARPRPEPAFAPAAAARAHEEPLIVPLVAPGSNLAAAPAIERDASVDEPADEPLVEPEPLRLVEPVAHDAPAVQLFDQFAAELAEGVDDEPIVVEPATPSNPLEAMLAPFVEAPHEVPMRRHMDALPKPEGSERSTPASAPGEPNQILLAVGGEPVRYVDAEMEDALDMLARAAREEILAANAPEPAPTEAPARKPADEGPWLAPIRKAWEPPAEDQTEQKRWNFRRK